MPSLVEDEVWSSVHVCGGPSMNAMDVAYEKEREGGREEEREGGREKWIPHDCQH